MKNIDWNKIKKEMGFQLSPAFKFERDLKDLVDDFKIKIIAYEDEPEIIVKIFQLANQYFSRDIIQHLTSYIKKDTKRHLVIMDLLDYENYTDEL